MMQSSIPGEEAMSTRTTTRTMTRTKIICTMGPSVNRYETILQLIDAGMNVARVNFSHGTHEEHAAVIALLKKARHERSCPLAIMVDTKGPEVRLGMVKNEQFPVTAKQRLKLVKQELEGTPDHVTLTPPSVIDTLSVGSRLLIDDGYLIAHVVEKNSDSILIEIENAGFIKSQKSLNVPGVDLHLPAMTEQDVADLTFACAQDVDLIAASFIRSAQHVHEIKHLLDKKNKAEIQVIAKIENSLGVQNFDEIVQVADGIMVARGDLGVEMPLQQVPSLQKMMIRKCYHVAKPVITATQMLESMIKNPRPTRAEASDVANAIYDSTSAVMLSGETAVGQYPIETVEMMKSIVEEAEKDFNYRAFFQRDTSTKDSDISHSVALASVNTAYAVGASAIFCFTSSGATSRLISSLRPQMPIIALTPNEKVYHQLALTWGTTPMACPIPKNAQDAFLATSTFACSKHLVAVGDRVVVTSGSPFGISGSTNMMLVETVEH